MSQALKTTKGKRQRRQKLSIQEISPEWAILLARLPQTEEHQYYIRGQKLDISDCKYCVVGEAYGFDDSYQDFNSGTHCHACYYYSVDFGHALTDSPEIRELMIDDFVDHWNTKHA
jgi:hypothetical protein